ncbi:ATP/GTP-binding protein [Streptomyces coacervatus]|uniref:ATP/GTP-binding protein n=1 Tax=Streptomyces coacervatus TaxID=647381 RepID=A0ABP7JA88_9ACTN
MSCVAAVLLVAGTAPALADGGWGSVDCSQNPYAGCELGAGKGGGGSDVPRRAKPRVPSPRGGGSENGGSGGSSARDPNLAMCAYERSDYEPPPVVATAAYHGPADRQRARAVRAVFVSRLGPSADSRAGNPKPGEKGAWYVYKCTEGGARDAFYRPPVWIPDGAQIGGGAHAAPTPADLAQQARKQLRLPSLAIEMSPRGEQLVNLPTWFWLDRGDWRDVSATASVPGVAVTAVARPTQAVWRPGDGGTVTCGGPGTPYDSVDAVHASSPSPDCGHTYRTSSAGHPGEAYAFSVTVHWAVTWTGAGQSGVFPDLTTTSNVHVRVAESHALNTGRRYGGEVEG